MNETLYIDRQPVDMNEDTNITLNFKSNILGDISKITASNSQTIQLPKTTRNRRIFDNPTAPAYLSKFRYKRHEAHYFRNGINVIGKAYAILLDSSDNYEIALFWGVMTPYQKWVDDALKLGDINSSESVAWNSASVPDDYAMLQSRGYGYAAYDCGVSDTSKMNIHPCATAWWVLNKISTQAGFGIEIPDAYKEPMKRIAIPSLQRNPSPESWEAEKTTVNALCTTIYEYPNGSSTDILVGAYTIGYINAKASVQVRSMYIGNNVAYRYKYTTTNNYKTVYMAEFSTASLDEIEIYINALAVSVATYTRIIMYTKKGSADYIEYKSWLLSTAAEIREVVDCSEFDKYYFILKSPAQESAGYEIRIEITPHADDVIYPSKLRIAMNLPEISQIDFIKSICAMLGLYVTTGADNTLRFVSLDTLIANKSSAIDWSRKLIDSGGNEPKTTKFKINDYCRNNLFKYKEDDTVTTSGSGNLPIDNETLEVEKTVVTLPYSATDGNKIPQYKWSDDKTEVKTQSTKPRIMMMTQSTTGKAQLSFAGLEFNALLTKYYASMSKLLNNAICIVEKMRLDEFDLYALDYTIPIYLRQYGRHYGIISVRASDDACEVELMQMPCDDVLVFNIELRKSSKIILEAGGGETIVINDNIPVEVRGGGEYISGMSVTVSAKSYGGYSFQYWIDLANSEIVSRSANYEFVATKNVSLCAYYLYTKAQ